MLSQGEGAQTRGKGYPLAGPLESGTSWRLMQDAPSKACLSWVDREKEVHTFMWMTLTGLRVPQINVYVKCLRDVGVATQKHTNRKTTTGLVQAESCTKDCLRLPNFSSWKGGGGVSGPVRDTPPPISRNTFSRYYRRGGYRKRFALFDRVSRKYR